VLPDADYVIRVTAIDVVGNAAVDSMVVTTANGNPSSVPADDARQLVLHQSYPNPGSNGACLAFTLPTPDRVTLDIYAPSGRLVRRLVDAVLGEGRHTFPWDGRDSGGLDVAAGTYLYRLTGATGVHTRKLLLIR
jgi:hypothetical protein